jgi:hypothetical protein
MMRDSNSTQTRPDANAAALAALESMVAENERPLARLVSLTADSRDDLTRSLASLVIDDEDQYRGLLAGISASAGQRASGDEALGAVLDDVLARTERERGRLDSLRSELWLSPDPSLISILVDLEYLDAARRLVVCEFLRRRISGSTPTRAARPAGNAAASPRGSRMGLGSIGSAARPQRPLRAR